MHVEDLYRVRVFTVDYHPAVLSSTCLRWSVLVGRTKYTKCMDIVVDFCVCVSWHEMWRGRNY